MDRTNSVRAEERFLSAHFRQLPEIKRCFEAVGPPDTAHGRIYRFAWQSRNLLRAIFKQWELVVLNQKERLRQDCFYLPPRTLSLSDDAMWFME